MSFNLDKSTWKRVVFGDVVRNTNVSVRNQEAPGIDRLIAMEHLDPGELKIERWGSLADGTTFTRRVKPGQTLFGKRRAYQRKVAYAEFDAICSGDILTFETVESQLLSEFLPFLVQSNEFFDHALGTSAGSLSPRTNWRDLSTFEFDLPSLDEQKRIADLLWAVERHQRDVANEITSLALAQSRWLETILSEGKTERGWAARMVPELLTAGPTNGKSAIANDEKRGVPTLSLSAIRDGQVLGGPAVKYIDVSPRVVENFVIEVDDFLVVRGNGNKQLTGRGGLADGELPAGCVYPDLLIRLRFDPDQILPAFAAIQWNSGSAHDALIKKAKSTNGIWKINGKDIKSHQLIVPPIHEQHALLKKLGTFQTAATSLRAQSGALRALRSSLLVDIFGGN